MDSRASPAPPVTNGEPWLNGSKGSILDDGNMVTDPLMRYGVRASGDVNRCRIGRLPFAATVWATRTLGNPKPRETARRRGRGGARRVELPSVGRTFVSLTRAFAARSASPVYAVLSASPAAGPVVVSPCWAAVRSLVRMRLAWSTVSSTEAGFAFGGPWMPRTAGAAPHPATDAPMTTPTTDRAMARRSRVMSSPLTFWRE